MCRSFLRRERKYRMQSIEKSLLSSILKNIRRSILLRAIAVIGLLLASLLTVSLGSPSVQAASSEVNLPSHHAVPYQTSCLNIYGNRVTTIGQYFVSGQFFVDNGCTNGISGSIDLYVSVYNCTFDPPDAGVPASLYYNLGPGKTRGVGYTGFGQCLECPNKTRYSTFTILIQVNASDHSSYVELANTNLFGSSTSLHGYCGTDISGNLSYTSSSRKESHIGRLRPN